MNSTAATPLVPVSWGELLDKITILEIKRQRIRDPEARGNVVRELQCLAKVATGRAASEAAARLHCKLRAVNEELWQIEDALRVLERERDFGPTFVTLARSVYRKNDQRAAIKRELNRLLGSDLIEEKSYSEMAIPSELPLRA